MADTIQFELVSPERLLLSRAVEMVVIPGGEGYFGALPGHAPLLSTLEPGVIDVYENGSITERLFVDGGFAEVIPERCTVLADAATPVSQLDRAKAEQDFASAKQDVAAKRENYRRQNYDRVCTAELRIAERGYKVAAAKLTALGERPAY